MTKIDYSLAPIEFDDVILVLQHSAETGKYGRDSWLRGIDFDTEKNIASMKRHITEYRSGLREDLDNGLHPLLMVACRALMQYTLDVRNKKFTEAALSTHEEYGYMVSKAAKELERVKSNHFAWQVNASTKIKPENR